MAINIKMFPIHHTNFSYNLHKFSGIRCSRRNVYLSLFNVLKNPENMRNVAHGLLVSGVYIFYV